MMLTFSPKADACTNIIVTKGASTDGSVMVSYAADSHWLYGELYFSPAADWPAGSMRTIKEWDSHKILGQIPQVAHTYKRVGNMNEHQLIIAETTFGGREELMDKNGIVDYGSLIYIALERCKTAKEAIKTIVDLANEYGYHSEGESMTIADKDEVWVMDIVGKGTGGEKGVVWVARRIPDGYICSHANQSRIGKFPLNDPENCLYAPDVISFARSKGYFSGKDEDFSFQAAFNPYEFSGLRGCEGRVWSVFNTFGKGKFVYEDEKGNTVTKDAKEYLDFAMGYNANNPMPFCVKPAEKVSLKDVADMMRDHFEGTPMDMTKDAGAGGNALPYRWRPMTFEYNGKHYVFERAIATQQTGFWFVGQSRSWLPDTVGGIIWFGTDDAATSYVTPIYTNIESVPECFAVGNGNLLEYSPTSSFWINNRVANACYKMYDKMASYVRNEIDAFENEQMKRVAEQDAKVLALLKSSSKNEDLAKKQLTEFSVKTAQDQFEKWVKLEETLLVKFIDGNVKAQNEDGSFKHSEYYEGDPADLTQPGYTDTFKKVLAETYGDVMLIPEE